MEKISARKKASIKLSTAEQSCYDVSKRIRKLLEKFNMKKHEEDFAVKTIVIFLLLKGHENHSTLWQQSEKIIFMLLSKKGREGEKGTVRN